jgi:4'-phosphopantetheinyl transferase EntD
MNNFGIDVEKILMENLMKEIHNSIIESMEELAYGYSPRKLKE